MTGSSSTPTSTVKAVGRIEGLVDVEGPADWGPVHLFPDGHNLRFELHIEAVPESEVSDLTEHRIAAAVEAAVGANCDTAVKARVEGISVSQTAAAGAGRVAKFVRATWDVHVLARQDAESVDRAGATAELVLRGGRPQHLHRIYLLGVEAMQDKEPIVGLWAFSAVIEEGHPKGKQSVGHAINLASALRKKGYVIPTNPARKPAAIRAAALHSAPKTAMPSDSEVQWFRALAWAYLCDRTLSA